MSETSKTQNDIYEIVQGIFKAVSISYDGPTYNDEIDNSVGLRREEGNPLLDKRIMDGFGVKVGGRILTINYNSEIPLSEITNMGPNKFEAEIESMIEKCLTFIKKEYKKGTGKALSVKELKRENKKGKTEKDFDVEIIPISRVRTSIKAHKCYELLGIPKEEEHKSDVIEQYEKYHKNLFKNKKKIEEAKKRVV